MFEVNNDYVYFLATRDTPEKEHYIYILTHDFTVEPFSYSGQYNKAIKLENIFNICQIEEVEEKVKGKKFEVREWVGEDLRGYDEYEFRKVKLEFKPCRINVKLTYFEEDFE